MCILFTNPNLSSSHSKSVPRRRSKASTYSYAKKATYKFIQRITSRGIKGKQEHRIRVPTLGCGVLDRGNKSKKRHKSENKNAFWIVSLDSIHRLLFG